ncbi:MAG: hypothetical protein PHU75_11395 [Candidatus Nanopelagicales bacterium]|nr:hypothetical protein [Candidatus Nanopelagicales bacterium]
MTTLRTRLIALLLATLSISLAGPALVSTAVQASVIVPASTAALPGQVSQFRQGVAATLRDYFATYGDRLSATERAQMNTLVAQVDDELGALQRKASAGARLARAGAPAADQRRAARATARSFDAAYARAMASLDKVQPILAPKLSIFEALRAKSDFDRQMQAFEELGASIHDSTR